MKKEVKKETKKEVKQVKKEKEPIPLPEELTDDHRDDLLVELSGTIYWPAIMTYFSGRKTYVDNGLRTLDPFQAPTEVARNQGTLLGLGDLELMVKILKEKRADEEKTENEGKDK